MKQLIIILLVVGLLSTFTVLVANESIHQLNTGIEKPLCNDVFTCVSKL